jgi:hypothetical protein
MNFVTGDDLIKIHKLKNDIQQIGTDIHQSDLFNEFEKKIILEKVITVKVLSDYVLFNYRSMSGGEFNTIINILVKFMAALVEETKRK